ncbi:hypothetical protein Henu3_gp111 [Mycobacterium phage Henu3 PeY-2017]|nr:hypothetical protein Henu3_gp111 [Mycobacterium phage Henu3 PeY-2017]
MQMPRTVRTGRRDPMQPLVGMRLGRHRTLRPPTRPRRSRSSDVGNNRLRGPAVEQRTHAFPHEGRTGRQRQRGRRSVIRSHRVGWETLDVGVV